MNLKIDINVCRVCLKSGNGISLFTTENFSDKYRYCTNLKPTQNDGLPEKLCPKCVTRLKISYEFKRQSESSNKYLTTFINQVNNEFNKTVGSSNNKEVDDEMNLLMEAGYCPEDEEQLEEEEEEESKKHVIQQINIPDEKTEENLKVEVLSMSDGEELMMEEEEQHEEELVEVKNYKSLEEEIFGEEEHLDEENDGEECIYDDEMEVTEDHGTADEGDAQIIYINVAENPEIEIKQKHPKKEGLKNHYCTKCEKDFSTKTNLIRHLHTHDGLRPYECNICGAGFTQNGSLKQHLRIHTGERPYECKICQRGFTQSKSLTFHMRRHTGEKPYTCDICGLTFRQRDGLKRHNVAKHSEQEPGEQHVCDICDKVLFSKYTLAMHTKKHLGGEEIHKCADCEKSFASKSSLQNHMRQHTGERPFECDQCNKTFAQKGSLTAHLKQHLDVKPFQCHLCSRGFIQKHQLVNHVNMHTNQPVKKFQCIKCFKSFSIKRNLLAHLKTHTTDEISSYKCDDCNIAFSSSRGLKLHRNNQHKELIKDLNNCEFCDTPFVTLNDLNEHIMAEHDSIDANCEICDLNFNSKKSYEDHLEEHELSALE